MLWMKTFNQARSRENKMKKGMKRGEGGGKEQ